jgi:hypothetical protein
MAAVKIWNVIANQFEYQDLIIRQPVRITLRFVHIIESLC